MGIGDTDGRRNIFTLQKLFSEIHRKWKAKNENTSKKAKANTFAGVIRQILIPDPLFSMDSNTSVWLMSYGLCL